VDYAGEELVHRVISGWYSSVRSCFGKCLNRNKEGIASWEQGFTLQINRHATGHARPECYLKIFVEKQRRGYGTVSVLSSRCMCVCMCVPKVIVK
jgi:hypothetical protein